ncbi:6-phosphogluconolactonase [Afipia sp. 1NLS2]|nr:6-phosphogluconolactonase [Afipia sp. 1NLS2]
MTMPRPRIIIERDAVALAERAAERVVARARENTGEPAICLTGGSTPKRLYQLLATPEWRNQLPWQRVQWFIGDDRFVPPDDELSNIGMARHAFLDGCAPPENIHAIPTDAASPVEAARAYEQTLREFQARHRTDGAPLFDLVLLGVGPDGHTASLFPGYPAASETEHWVAGVPQAHVAPFVPRVSLTLPCLAQCREMLLLASGHDKRAILSRVLAGEDLPAAHAQSARGETWWLIDRAAAPESCEA